MTTEFTLIPNPTFSATATIPRAGLEDGEVKFTFKHHTPVEIKDKLRDMKAEEVKANKNKKEEEGEEKTLNYDFASEYILWIAEGWALPDAFTKANIITMLQNYPRAYVAITGAYNDELIAFRVKN